MDSPTLPSAVAASDLGSDPSDSTCTTVDQASTGDAAGQLPRGPRASRQQHSGLMAGLAALGASAITAAVAGALMSLRRRRRKASTDVPPAEPAAAAVSGASTPSLLTAGRPFSFGSPVLGSPSVGLSSTPQGGAPSTATPPAPAAPAAAAAAAAPPAWDAAAMQAQMVVLKQMQEENERLRGFVTQFMATSQKVTTLEAENEALKAATARLEADVREMRSASVVMDGGELERFKNALHLAPGARSVCSLADSELGGGDGSASVDGGPTGRSKARAVSLLKWFNTTLARQQQAATPSAGGSVSGDAGSVAASAAATGPLTPGGSRRTSRATHGGSRGDSQDVAKTLNNVADLLERHWQM